MVSSQNRPLYCCHPPWHSFMFANKPIYEGCLINMPELYLEINLLPILFSFLALQTQNLLIWIERIPTPFPVIADYVLLDYNIYN